LALSRCLCHIIDRFSFGEIKLWDLAGWLIGYVLGEEGALGEADIGFGHFFVFVLFVTS
jgi:hypothetical protein